MPTDLINSYSQASDPGPSCLSDVGYQGWKSQNAGQRSKQGRPRSGCPLWQTNTV